MTTRIHTRNETNPVYTLWRKSVAQVNLELDNVALPSTPSDKEGNSTLGILSPHRWTVGKLMWSTGLPISGCHVVMCYST